MNQNMRGEQTYLEKIIQLENELTGLIEHTKMQLPYIPKTRIVNISKAISQFHTRGVRIQNSHIFYMDYQKKMYVSLGVYPFPNDIYLKYQHFLAHTIKLRYRRINPDSPKRNNSPIDRKPIKKVRQRTIAQAIDSVTKWRNLYQQLDSKGKKIYTLQSAAQMVGISKKTLDDYFYQIKLAERYKFDFERYHYQKIGIMRSYIRQNQNKIKVQDIDINIYLASESDQDKK